MRVRLRMVLFALLGLIVVVVGAAVTVLMTMDFSQYRGAIEQRVADLTGRTFKIGSDFHVVVGLSPMLVANDVELANASWGTRPNMAVIKQFEVQINLLPLLFGTFSIDHVKLVNTDILLETDAHGRGNWDFQAPGAAAMLAAPPPGAPQPAPTSAASLPQVHNLQIEGALLQFRDGQTKVTQRFSLGHLNLKEDSRGAPLKVDINGTYNDFYFEIGGILGTVTALSGGGAEFPVDITAKLGATDTAFRIQGQFKDLPAAKGYDLRVTATTSEMAQFGDFLRDAHFGTFKLPKVGPLKADIEIADKGPANAATGGVPALVLASIDAGRPDLLHVQVSGSVQDLIGFKGIDLGVAASGQEIGALSHLELPGVPNGLPEIPALGPYKLAVKLASGPNRVSLPTVRLDLGRDDQLKLTVTGAIRDPLGGKGYALTLDGAAPDLAVVARELKIGLPLTGPLVLNGKIADEGPQRYTLSGLLIKAEGSDIGGSGSLSLASARPTASANLNSTLIDLGKLMPSLKSGPSQTQGQTQGQAQGQAKGATDGRVFPADPLPLQMLSAVDADLHYHAATIRTPDGPEFRDTTIQMDLHNGNLSVQPVASTIGKGQVTGAVSLAGTGATALKLAIKNVSLEEIDHEVPGEHLVDGGLTNADVDVKGAGSSVRAIMASLNGTVYLGIGPGSFKSRYTDVIGLGGLEDVIGKSLPKLEHSTLHCLVLRFDASDGIAKSRVLMADSARLTLDGSGTINLKTEQLDLGLDTHTKVTNLLSLMPPISIGGTLGDPDFAPNVGAAAVGVIGNVVDDILRQPGNVIGSLFGGSDQTPADQKICNAAYAKAERTGSAGAVPKAPAGQTSPAQAQPQNPPSKSTGDKVQDLGQGIQRSLRGLFGQ